MPRFGALVWLLLLPSCSEGPDRRGGRSGAEGHDSAALDTPTDAPSETATGGDTGTGDTTPSTTPVDCTALPRLPGPEHVQQEEYLTEEDFDFDPRGFLVSQMGSDLVGVDPEGVQVLAAGIGGDAAGIRVLPSGDIAVAQPNSGAIEVVAAEGGGHHTVFSGLRNPNGLAVDTEGRLFASEFVNNGRVLLIDPRTSESWPVADGLTRPNGIALTPDESTVYVVANGGEILAFDRLTPTTFGPQRLLADLEASVYALATDACGNVYGVQYFRGVIHRVSADGTVAEILYDIDSIGTFSALRFGNGVLPWARHKLFVTSRARLFGLDLDIPGRPPVHAVP